MVVQTEGWEKSSGKRIPLVSSFVRRQWWWYGHTWSRSSLTVSYDSARRTNRRHEASPSFDSQYRISMKKKRQRQKQWISTLHRTHIDWEAMNVPMPTIRHRKLQRQATSPLFVVWAKEGDSRRIETHIFTSWAASVEENDTTFSPSKRRGDECNSEVVRVGR